ncbi:MAG: restriction endonuclease [Candidatus Thorarchaeota archaeon]
MIDFKELSVGIAGERLEAVARAIGMGMGLVSIWSGRGADQGKDLIFTETLKGQLHEESKKWLVQCKDNSQSNKSVSEADCGAILDKVLQHQCDGYLLVTTTTAGTALKAKLDALAVAKDRPILTLVWDMYLLDLLLRKSEYSDVFKSYFPKSWKQENKLPLEDALSTIESKLTGDQFERLTNELELQPTSQYVLHGYHLAPNDKETSSTIDKIVTSLEKGDIDTATDNADALEADVLTKLFHELKKQQFEIASDFLRNIVRCSKQPDLALNAFQILVDNEELSSVESVELSSYMDTSELETLFGDEITGFVQDEILSNGTDYDFWNDVDQLSSRSSIDWVYLTELRLKAPTRQQIHFEGTLELAVRLEYDREAIGNPLSFPGTFKGYFDPYGIHLSNVTIDTSSFYE